MTGSDMKEIGYIFALVAFGVSSFGVGYFLSKQNNPSKENSPAQESALVEKALTPTNIPPVKITGRVKEESSNLYMFSVDTGSSIQTFRVFPYLTNTTQEQAIRTAISPGDSVTIIPPYSEHPRRDSQDGSYLIEIKDIESINGRKLNR